MNWWLVISLCFVYHRWSQQTAQWHICQRTRKVVNWPANTLAFNTWTHYRVYINYKLQYYTRPRVCLRVSKNRLHLHVYTSIRDPFVCLPIGHMMIIQMSLRWFQGDYFIINESHCLWIVLTSCRPNRPTPSIQSYGWCSAVITLCSIHVKRIVFVHHYSSRVPMLSSRECKGIIKY